MMDKRGRVRLSCLDEGVFGREERDHVFWPGAFHKPEKMTQRGKSTVKRAVRAKQQQCQGRLNQPVMLSSCAYVGRIAMTPIVS